GFLFKHSGNVLTQRHRRLAIFWSRTPTASQSRHRKAAFRVTQAHVQCGIGAHGMSHDVRPLDRKGVHEFDHIETSPVLLVQGRIGWHVRRWITARAEGDASMRSTEAPHLRLPGPVITGKFMDEDYRLAFTLYFVVQIHAIAGFEDRHARPPCLWSIF